MQIKRYRAHLYFFESLRISIKLKSNYGYCKLLFLSLLKRKPLATQKKESNINQYV